MDPNATLEAADQAISDLDLDLARAHLATYREWRDKGGFEPHDAAHSGMRGDAFALVCDARIESVEAQRTLQEARDGAAQLKRILTACRALVAHFEPDLTVPESKDDIDLDVVRDLVAQIKAALPAS